MVQQTPSVSLLNPLTGREIPLPPITTIPDVLAYRPEKLRREYLLRLGNDGRTVAHDKKLTQNQYISRVAVSAEPGSSSEEEEEPYVMAICVNNEYRLAFCKPNGSTWKMIPQGGGVPHLIAFADVVFWRGQFYALDYGGSVFVCDLSLPEEPKLSFVLDHDPRHCLASDHCYLVVSPAGDELMLVVRDIRYTLEHLALFEQGHGGGVFYNEEEDEEEGVIEAPDVVNEPDASIRIYWTSKFRVYKLVDKEDAKGWNEVESIGDFALFLGYNSPAAFVSTVEHPGLTPNSIYFTDDLTEIQPWWSRRHKGGHDMGIYSLTTRTIQPLYSATSVDGNPFLMSPPPVWISPPNH
ncbi:unnamed protein product [Linum tenue]|uniref:KIB1-4 beta-propeller domain-containing protein n=1 Tax=Linum tenue TaxID=586396 RepID=A0AAV0Q9W7_9ROSI|nr:unnamed protein product [Linum tenue]